MPPHPTHPPHHADAPAALAEARHRARAEADPADPLAHADHAAALLQLARPAQALAACERALALVPGFAPVLVNRGTALQGLGRYEEAVASFDEALRLQPDDVLAWSNRGNALQGLARWDEAVASYDCALALLPGLVPAPSHGAAAPLAHRAAAPLAHRAAALLAHRAAALLAWGRVDEAVAGCDRALAIDPRNADTLCTRGDALKRLARHAEALACYRQALAIDPDHRRACVNLGNLLMELKEHEAAARCYARVLALGGGPADIEGRLLDAQLHGCDWTDREARVGRVLAAMRAGQGGVAPLTVLALSGDADDALRCARLHAARRCPPQPPLWRGERYRHERIRVAYLSATFHDHAVSRLLAGVLERHDREKFAIHGVSFGPDDGSALRARVCDACEDFIDVRGWSDEAIAARLRALEIDIAVDLNGYTARESRPGVLAWRPAPVQVNYLGYPGTLGASFIDYLLADRWLIPPEDEAFYTEKVVRLPHSYQPNDDRMPAPGPAPDRAAAGLPPSGLVFCCFNNSYKITPEVFGVWMRILQRVPGSVLWLLEDTAAAARHLRREAEGRGVDPQRLVFAPRADLAAHLARHALADLFLDTLPYNAHVTASDALRAGVPLVTCSGTGFAGRVAASLLHACGLPELVTQDLAQYEALAVRLATDPVRLAALRATLARQRGTQPLFDTRLSCRHLEAAYTAMWQRQQAGLPPAPFDVSAQAAG
jgi:predicted O-linked N-acetylglucosamine transferase (SPINDLY family)